MKIKLVVFLALLAVTPLFICRPSLAASSAADLAAAEAAVRRADAHWAAAARTASVDAWTAFYAADAIILLPNGDLASGRELVHQSVTRLLALPRLSVAWHPIKVEMARSGDLAYLIGAYELEFGGAQGAPVADRGRLLEIWRLQGDGTWKCVVDTWNSDETTATPSASALAPTLAPAPAPAPALALAPAVVPASESPAANPVMSPPTPAQAEAAKYGDMPTHYQEAIRRYFQKRLKHPDSVQYQQITQPEKGYTTAVTGAFLMRETRDYGWTVKAKINAKNSHGSYAGFKSYTFLFRGEDIVHTVFPLPMDEMN